MRQIQIDFAPRRGWWEAGRVRRLRPLWWLLCGGMLAVLAALFVEVSHLEAQRLEVKAQLERVRSAMSDAQEEDTRNESASLDSAEAVEQAGQFINYPWPSLVGSLEKTQNKDVHLMSLELGVMRPTSKMVLEAGNVNVALDYLNTLREEPGFASMALVKQETVTNQGEARLRFTFETPAARSVQHSSAKGAQ